MSKAFESIQVERTDSGWLPVRRYFEPAVKHLDGNNNEAKVKAVCDIVVPGFFKARPVSTAQPGLEPAHGELRKEAAITTSERVVL